VWQNACPVILQRAAQLPLMFKESIPCTKYHWCHQIMQNEMDTTCSLHKEEEKCRGNCIRQNFLHSTATGILRKTAPFSNNTSSTQESHCRSTGTYSSPQLTDLLTEMQQACRKWCPSQFMIARIGLSGFELFLTEWLLEIYTDNFLLNLYQCKLLSIKIYPQNPRSTQDLVTKITCPSRNVVDGSNAQKRIL
jgi:hypothetical protein